MNELVVKTNKQTNNKLRAYYGFYLSSGDVGLVEAVERLRNRDGWTRTRLFKAALAEYVARHDPGNPGLSLNHWTESEPFSPAAKEKLAPKRLCPVMEVHCQGVPLHNCRFKSLYVCQAKEAVK